MNWIAIPDCPHYWLQRASVPVALLATNDRIALSLTATEEGLALVDIRIADGRVAEIQPHVSLNLRPNQFKPSATADSAAPRSQS